AVSIEGGDLLYRWGAPPPAKPYCVGYQAAGVVREVGANVQGLEAGMRVTTVGANGSHAQLRAVHERAAHRVPDGLAIEAAATVPVPYSTADDCLFEYGRLQAGETVLVQAGASGVGLAAVQLAKRHGATVLATASSRAKLERLREYGVDHGIDYKTEDLVARVKELTAGRGADVIVDGVGGDVTQQSFRACAPRGRVCMFGNVDRGSFTYKYDLNPMRGNRAVIGVSLASEAGTDRVRAIVARHLEAMARGELRAVIDRSFPLADAAQAHAYVESRQAFGRVLLVP
ncbi:MAG TPA: zinc-binding dehydrogenase, partial [Polyangiales bacterium]|nr:zinc-binding dehydrogenase [Polyangiales bacterium]